MDSNLQPPAALDEVRVLDLAGPPGLYCCKLLGDLGADVIKVEKPGGDDCRRQPPFHSGAPGPNRSISFFSLNTSKRSITLNLETGEGRSIFTRLAEKADILVETFPPGYLDGLGVGYESLKHANPRLIVTSITPYGQTGPYRSLRGTDLTAQAMGGLMHRVGYPEDPPCRIGGEQAHLLASVQAATATLLALYWREFTGQGQHVDVSIHESVVNVDMYSVPTYYVSKEIMGRRGLYHAVGAAALWECKDGYVRYYPGGERDVGGWDELVQWMDDEGMAEDLKDPRWQDMEVRFREIDHVVKAITAFFKRHTKAELWSEGQRRRIMIHATNNVADLLADPQLVEEGFFVDVEHHELETTITYPGNPYRLSRTPWRVQRRPPLVGEHNVEVYGQELGLTRYELASLQERGVI